ncbi:MAG: Gfo/Idh/MocA family oxidoreductase [Spirochaetes bacterium]|jgi:predicted dehydrogenase|nr:Gfo/Idh/MocA family oxidoreductase [Spirochaetota bacterium]
MKRPSIALIGCGRIGFMLESDPLRYKPCTHFGGASSAGLRITHACDIDPGRLEGFVRASGIPRENAFTSHRELFDSVRPDLVIISTWTQSHAEIGIRAAENGARVVVCEKPIASNLRDASRLIASCKARGARLIINHERRYDMRYQKIKEMLDDGAIGEIRSVHAVILSGGFRGISRIEQGGGPLLHDGTHMIDLIRYFFGDIATVIGDFDRSGNRRSGFEDRATAWIRTRGGVDVFLEAGGARDYFVFELGISGTSGKIIAGNGYQSFFTTRASKHYTGFRDLVEKPFPRFRRHNYFTGEYSEAKRLLSGQDVSIRSTGLDGYRAIEAIHAIYLSAGRGRKIVELPVKPDTIRLKEIFSL